ncbi:MAG: hypothetical protein AB2551_09125 [Candidatus Thiodiazotropha sp.]
MDKMFKTKAKFNGLSYPQSTNTYSSGLGLLNTAEKARKTFKKQLDTKDKLRYLQA